MAAISSGTQPAMLPVARRSHVDKAAPLFTLHGVRITSVTPSPPGRGLG